MNLDERKEGISMNDRKKNVQPEKAESFVDHNVVYIREDAEALEILRGYIAQCEGKTVKVVRHPSLT